MPEAVRSTFKTLGIYSIGNIAAKLVGFVLLPLYTTAFEVAEFGRLALYEITGEFILAIYLLGLSDILSRYYWDKRYAGRQGEVFFNVFATVGLLDLGMLLATLAVGRFLLSGQIDFGIFLPMSLAVFLRSIVQFPLLLFRIQLKASRLVTLNLLSAAIQLGATIYFVVSLGLGIRSVFMAQILANGAILLIITPFILKNCTPRWNRPLATEMIHHAAPLIVSRLAYLVLSMGDRYLLGLFKSSVEVAIYALAARFVGVVRVVVINSFQMGYTHIYFRETYSEERRIDQGRMFDYLLAILAIAGTGLMLYSGDVIRLMSGRAGYLEAIPVIPILNVGMVLYGAYYLFALTLIGEKKTRAVTRIVITAAILNMAMNAVLIPVASVYGAALATGAANVVMVLLAYRESRGLGLVRYHWGRGILLLTAFTMIAALCSFDLTGNWPVGLSVAVKTVGLGAFVLLFWKSGYLGRDDKAAVWRWMRRAGS